MARTTTAAAAPESDAQRLVRTVRELTEAQFDFWLEALNRAVAAMGGPAEVFGRDDRQKTVSYWYILMYLLEKGAGAENPFAIAEARARTGEGLLTVKRLSSELADRYKAETVRRYITDLKRYRLVALEGRGPEARVKLAEPTALALVQTIRHWMNAFNALDRQYGDIALAQDPS